MMPVIKARFPLRGGNCFVFVVIGWFQLPSARALRFCLSGEAAIGKINREQGYISGGVSSEFDPLQEFHGELQYHS